VPVTMPITSISGTANPVFQQQQVCLLGKVGDIDGKLLAEGEVLVVEGRDVEEELVAQVEVEEGQGWRHAVVPELGGGIPPPPT